MAVFEHTRPIRSASRGSAFTAMIGAFVAWNDRRMTAKALNALTDHELDDIGLSRADIDRVADVHR